MLSGSWARGRSSWGLGKFYGRGIEVDAQGMGILGRGYTAWAETRSWQQAKSGEDSEKTTTVGGRAGVREWWERRNGTIACVLILYGRCTIGGWEWRGLGQLHSASLCIGCGRAWSQGNQAWATIVVQFWGLGLSEVGDNGTIRPADRFGNWLGMGERPSYIWFQSMKTTVKFFSPVNFRPFPCFP